MNNPTPENSFPKNSVWILGDQLAPAHPLLDLARKTETQIVMIESRLRQHAKAYHKKKIVLILSAMRHYAEELRQAGWQVDYRQAASLTEGLQAHLAEFGATRLLSMKAAEWEARKFQQSLTGLLGIEVELSPNRHFLVEQFQPVEKPGQKLILEHFYRAMRKHFQVLMEPDGKPTGDDWNFDDQNRKPYKGQPRPVPPLSIAPDAITRAVMAEVEVSCPNNLGSTVGFALPVTRREALLALDDFIENRLPYFGPYEDAMHLAEPTLFHSMLSPLLNIGLLEPLEVVQRAEQAYRLGQARLNSVEGFVRQILGWREYVYWRYHRMMPGFHERNHWDAQRPLPAFFYTGVTDMNCLNTVINKVLDTGYSHHIERLMVLCNFSLLAAINPQMVNNWFLESYFDAYDWVVTPNVIGMGLCADGGVVGTKPYIASAAYINKMSDYCQGCRYNPKVRTGAEACPFNFLYWNFLLNWEDRLRANPRMGPNVLGLKHLSPADRQQVSQAASEFLENLT